MTKLKLFLKNSAKSGQILLSLLILLASLSGCQYPSEPTYKEEDIPQVVKKICKEEYGLDVTTQRTPSTLWIYIPLDKMLHKDYGKEEDKIFDEEMTDKLRNILTTIGRVLISSDNTPEFFALLASDIKLGLDYTIIGYVLDMKKSYAGFIPWTEANRRYVIEININPEAINDKTGTHIAAYNVTLPDFLAKQMAQRISVKFQEEGRKKYFKVIASDGQYKDYNFILNYAIEKIIPYPGEIDIKKEILDTITYCIQTYEFKNFSLIEITDLVTQDKLIINKTAIWARPID